MATLMTELTRDEQAGTLYYTDRNGNLRAADGRFWLTQSHNPRVLWRPSKNQRESLFCDLYKVVKFLPSI